MWRITLRMYVYLLQSKYGEMRAPLRCVQSDAHIVHVYV